MEELFRSGSIDQNRSSVYWPLAKVLQRHGDAETGFKDQDLGREYFRVSSMLDVPAQRRMAARSSGWMNLARSPRWMDNARTRVSGTHHATCSHETSLRIISISQTQSWNPSTLNATAACHLHSKCADVES